MKRIVAILLVAVMLFLVGCSAHTHMVGNGAQGTDQVQQRQWYILFGIVPLNTVDSHGMAAGAQDYTIKTAQTPLDFVINIFTSIITVSSRTVTVTK